MCVWACGHGTSPQRYFNYCETDQWCGSTCVLQVAMLICAGFLIAWIPYAVVSVVSAFGEPDSVPISVSVIPTLLAKSSAMYNPIIYQVIDLKHSCAKSSCFQVLKKRTHLKKSRYGVVFISWLSLLLSIPLDWQLQLYRPSLTFTLFNGLLELKQSYFNVFPNSLLDLELKVDSAKWRCHEQHRRY